MPKTLVRDITLLAAAAAIGWWVRGANTPVQAQHAGGSFAYQFSGIGHDTVLSVYNTDNHTLYVYPAGIGNAHINCQYSLRIEKPGAPIERQNCGIGSAY